MEAVVLSGVAVAQLAGGIAGQITTAQFTGLGIVDEAAPLVAYITPGLIGDSVLFSAGSIIAVIPVGLIATSIIYSTGIVVPQISAPHLRIGPSATLFAVAPDRPELYATPVARPVIFSTGWVRPELQGASRVRPILMAQTLNGPPDFGSDFGPDFYMDISQYQGRGARPMIVGTTRWFPPNR